MRYKARKPLLNRARTATPSGPADGLDIGRLVREWETSGHGEFFFTPWLNSAAELVMAKADVVKNKHRAELWVLRNSWGNWCSYAVEGAPSNKIPVGPTEHAAFEALILGSGPCPFCGKKPAPNEQRIFRWHRPCIARAYARDAERLGSPAERKWAAEIFDSIGRG